MIDIDSGYVTIGQTKLYYEAAGAGEPLILMHAHSVDRRMWDPQFIAFAKSYRVIRFDFRGYGLSDMPEPGGFFRHADDVRGLLDALGITSAHFIGLSLGSMIAADMLALYAERVRSAVMASGIVYAEAEEGDRSVSEGLVADTSQSLPRNVDIQSYKQQWTNDLLNVCGSHGDEIRSKLASMIEDWLAWQPQYEMVRPLAGSTLTGLLKQADPSIPVLVVIGESDSEGSRRSSEAFLALRPAAKVLYMKEAGHFSSMEMPEVFNEEILRFLSGVEI